MLGKMWYVLGCLCVAEFVAGCDITFNIPVDLGGLNYGTVDANGIGFPHIPALGDLDAGSADAHGVDADAAVSFDAAADSRASADAHSVDGPDLGTVGTRVVRPMVVPIADASSGVIAVSTGASQCWGRHLATTNEYVRLAAAGMSVWHICYHTALWDAVVPGADPRPAHVVFYRYDSEMCTNVDFVSVDAPGSANPWTANIMVALPTDAPGYPPYFNIANVRDGGSEPDIIWAVQENVPESGRLALNGVIQVWHVGADGSQTLVQPGMTCTDPTAGMVTNRANFFVPVSEIVSGRPPMASCGGTPDVCSLVPY